MEYELTAQPGPAAAPEPVAAPETLALHSADGHRYSASLYRARGHERPVLLFWSALGTPARFYGRFAAALAGCGVHVVTADWRGIGSSSLRAGRGVDFGYRELVELDATLLVDRLRELFPREALWLGGHSLGGQVSALTATRRAEEVAGVVLVASGTSFRHCYRGGARLGVDLIAGMASGLTGLVGHFPGRQLGFGGREARTLMRDWAQVARSGRYQLIRAAQDYEAALAGLRKPVLALSFAADSWAPAAAADHLLAKMPEARPTRWRWTAADTGGQALDHFSWARAPEFIAPRLAEWLVERCGISAGGV